jgi:hypothetical protein
VKYLDKQFSSPANSRKYVENWEAIFGERRDDERKEPADDRPARTDDSQPA